VDYLCSVPKASGGKILKFAREAKTNLRKDRILNRREHKILKAATVSKKVPL
jgi:hypothetical protein